MSILYSVVIPLNNEEENIEELLEELEPVMKSLKAPYEVICVDDGSTDQTLPLLLKLQKTRPHLQIVVFDKNYGQSSAFDAGFKTAKGEFVITLDGDRQNDPRDIPELLAALGNCDLICGERKKRRDPLTKKVISFFANHVRSSICQDGIKDTGCSLKIYRLSALKKIPLFNGMHRFLPALFLIYGFKITQLPVNHRERTKGVSKYNFFNRSFNTIHDLLAVAWMRKRVLKYKVKQ